MKIVVLGYIVRGPLGGMCFHYLQYLLGLKRLGHDVFYLEDSDSYPSCYDPLRLEVTSDPAYGIRFISRLFEKYKLKDRWAYYDEHSNSWFGNSKQQVEKFCKGADVLINISNVNPLRDWWASIPNRILIDTDPSFTQIRHIEERRYHSIAEAHTHFFSFGEHFGKPGCLMPNDGFDWKPTRQPIVMDLWNNNLSVPFANWTTVMQWDSYDERVFNGIKYGMKSVSFQKFLDLPKTCNEKMELALGGKNNPADELRSHGWIISNPLQVALSDDDFGSYVKHSKGEFSVAKQGYVISKSGWFSERSANYLASGKPVILQDTGYSTDIETGNGIFAFNTMEDINSAFDKVNADYGRQCRYAREIAGEYFDSNKILTALLSRI